VRNCETTDTRDKREKEDIKKVPKVCFVMSAAVFAVNY
jgi:hypothetical protein